jgi:hypothetical protein
MSNIQLDIEWTEAASRKIEKLMPRGGQEAFLALPPVECLPMEGDVLFLGPDGKQQPFMSRNASITTMAMPTGPSS